MEYTLYLRESKYRFLRIGTIEERRKKGAATSQTFSTMPERDTCCLEAQTKLSLFQRI